MLFGIPEKQSQFRTYNHGQNIWSFYKKRLKYYWLYHFTTISVFYGPHPTIEQTNTTLLLQNWDFIWDLNVIDFPIFRESFSKIEFRAVLEGISYIQSQTKYVEVYKNQLK